MKHIFIIISVYLFGLQNIYGQKSIYVVDTVGSQILWYCGNHYGCVKLESGYISVINGKISSGNFIIDMSSINDDDITDNDLLRITLNNVLKSAQFFNIDEYFSSIFSILSVEKIDTVNYHVLGNLKIKNRARDIEFDSKITIDDEIIFVDTDEINIDRTKWGIKSLSPKYDPENKETMHVPDIINMKIYLIANKIKN